jgi:hypothetical protein
MLITQSGNIKCAKKSKLILEGPSNAKVSSQQHMKITPFDSSTDSWEFIKGLGHGFVLHLGNFWQLFKLIFLNFSTLKKKIISRTKQWATQLSKSGLKKMNR